MTALGEDKWRKVNAMCLYCLEYLWGLNAFERSYHWYMNGFLIKENTLDEQ